MLQEEKKAQEAQARALELAGKREKRREEAEIKKKAQVETRKIIAEVKSVAEKKKKKLAEKKLA